MPQDIDVNEYVQPIVVTEHELDEGGKDGVGRSTNEGGRGERGG